MSEFDMPARIKRLRLPPGRRIIAVSDIHGNLPYLKGLLKKIRFDADDILAICVQHEIDHLDGKLFIDRISRLKRIMFENKLKKGTRQSQVK